MSGSRLGPVLAPLIRAGLNHYFLRRQEELEQQRAEKRQEALERVDLSNQPHRTQRRRPQQSQPRTGRDQDRIDQLIAQEDCGVCRQALRELKRKSPAQRESGLEVYEQHYRPTKSAFEAGEVGEEELSEATDRLLEAAEL